jgi:hypothetical protein
MSINHTKEHQRIIGDQREGWQRWGTYIGNRAWGNVRENYHSEANAWKAFPFEAARSRAFRWTEDGIGGFSDRDQILCMAVALWNGQDPILKERFFGLTNDEANHGEDVKEFYFYLDGVPSYSYMKMLYKYPQAEYPYDRLRHESALRKPNEPEFELFDALKNTFEENRYFDVFIEYAKADTDDILCRTTAVNRGSHPAELHVLPHLWYRNTWSWQENTVRPSLRADGTNVVRVNHPELGEYFWYIESPNNVMFTENDTNSALLSDTPADNRYFKDGIDNVVVRGRHAAVNPEKHGSKCAAHYSATVQPGESFVVRTRLSSAANSNPYSDFEQLFAQRQQENDEFYAALQREQLSPEEKHIQRTAFAALNWNRDFYHFNVEKWLKGDSKGETPKRTQYESAAEWRHFDAHDIVSMPDSWEFPWLAAWDLAFQTVAIGILDPEFAKGQILLIISERYARADGAMPAFEGDFSTPHPPLYGWSALHIYEWNTRITGKRDVEFLRDVYRKLRLHFAWWLKNHRQENDLFNGGFLGMDNISLIDRNKEVPEGAWLAQADATGWMALFALNLLTMAVELEEEKDAVEFLDCFATFSQALTHLWDKNTHFFYDELRHAGGRSIPLKVRSLVGLVPLVAVTALDPKSLRKLPQLQKHLDTFQKKHPTLICAVGANGDYLLAAVTDGRIKELLRTVFDEAEFYSPYGMRSVSKYHEKNPVSRKIGKKEYKLTYEPGESSDNTFGGNSNWRGPLWVPLIQFMIEALTLYHGYYADKLKLPLPDGTEIALDQLGKDLVKRVNSLFKRNNLDRRPFFGDVTYFQNDPHWRDYILFYEYFHADSGRGLGASHQNGWTALIAKLLHDDGRPTRIP